MERTGFWTRVGQWFKSMNSMEPDQDNPGPDAAIVPQSATSTAAAATKVRRSAGLERLEEEYTRIVNLVERVQRHMEEQGDRSKHMADAFDRVAASLQSAPEAAQEHSRLLSSMDEKLAAQVASAKKVEGELAQLPALADSQRQFLVSIGRHLEGSRESQTALLSTLGELKESLGNLTESTTATSRAIEQSRSDASAREDRLAGVLSEQTKRFTIFGIAATAAAIVATGAAIAAIIVR